MKFKTLFLYFLFFLLNIQIIAQTHKSTNTIEFSIEPQYSAILVPFEDYPSDRNKSYEIGDNSRIYGLEITTSINFKSLLGIGLGLGKETLHLEKQKITYFPAYLELTPFPPKNPKNGFASLSGRIGTQFGEVDKNGIYLRADIGYYVPIIKHFSIYFKGIYTYQNLFKAFSNSNRPSNKYSFNGIGFGFGIEYY